MHCSLQKEASDSNAPKICYDNKYILEVYALLHYKFRKYDYMNRHE